MKFTTNLKAEVDQKEPEIVVEFNISGGCRQTHSSPAESPELEIESVKLEAGGKDITDTLPDGYLEDLEADAWDYARDWGSEGY